MVADTHLAVQPRGDVALLNGILVVLLDEGLVDLDAVRPHVDGLDELLAHLAGWTVERAARGERHRRRGRPRRWPAPSPAPSACTIAWTMGVNHSVQGTETVTLLNTLALLTGNIGRPGASPFSITGQCNAMGTRETGFTASMPGYRAYDDPAHRAELAALWGVDEDRLPTERGRAYPDIINAVMSGRIKGLWIIGTNPVVSFPNREVLEHAFRQLDLLVVQDGFETPTTALADVVLPAAIWGEKDGHVHQQRAAGLTGAGRGEPAGRGPHRLRHRPRPWPSAGAAGTSCSPGGRTPEDAFDEWRRVSAGRPCDYSGITYERIDAAGGVQWPCPADDPDVPLGGTARLYADDRFNRPDGKAMVHPVEPQPIRDAPRPEYPLLLNTGRTVEHWHTRTKTGRVAVLEGLAPEAWVEVHPDDAAELGLRSGDWHGALQPGRGRPHPGAGHRHRAPGRGVHPVPLGRALRQPPDRRPVRPHQPGAELQAVRGADRAHPLTAGPAPTVL